MNTANTIDAQLRAQIEGTQTIDIVYTDADPECAELTVQDGRAWLSAPHSNPHEITSTELAEIMAMVTDERKFNTDPLTLRTGMGYNEFWDRYYNGR